MGLDSELFIQMAFAAGVGLLVGLERSLVHEHSPRATMGGTIPDDDQDGEEAEIEYLGIRTFTVLSLIGYGAALAAEELPLVAPVALGAVAWLVITMFRKVNAAGLGITTKAAAIGVCGLGMLCRNHAEVAAMIALLVTTVLASRRFTHATMQKMRRVELTHTFRFLVVILIALPLLPHRTLDPLGLFDPFRVALLVVMFSGISFVGYVLTKVVGTPHGLGLAGVLGGLTSSTAVTAAMAARARKAPELRAICAFATVASCASMLGRVLFVVTVLDSVLAYRLAWPLGAMAATAALGAVVLWIVAVRQGTSRAEAAEISLKNPFAPEPAATFAFVFVLVLFVARLAQLYLGSRGMMAAAALSGLARVDAVALAVSELSRGGTIAREAGTLALTAAVAARTLFKVGVSFYSGGFRFGRLIALPLGLATAVGVVVAAMLR
jgi:uncharacterized membrane protein (DUF4010 family)